MNFQASKYKKKNLDENVELHICIELLDLSKIEETMESIEALKSVLKEMVSEEKPETVEELEKIFDFEMKQY